MALPSEKVIRDNPSDSGFGKPQRKNMNKKKAKAQVPPNARNAKIEDLAPFVEDGADTLLTTNQGLKINDNQNSLK